MPRKGDLSGGPNPLINSSTVINSSVNLNETIANLRLLRDDLNNIWGFPAVLVDLKSATQVSFLNGLSLKGNNVNNLMMQVANMGLYRDLTNGGWNSGEDPGATAVVSAVAANTNLLAAGGAGKQYKIFSCWLSVQATAALANDIQVTDGTNVYASIPGLGAAGNSTVSVNFGPNGMLSSANSAIATAAAAYTNAKVSAGVVYGAAR